MITPGKINMEPQNTSLEKENHLLDFKPSFSDSMFNCGGCSIAEYQGLNHDFCCLLLTGWLPNKYSKSFGIHCQADTFPVADMQ